MGFTITEKIIASHCNKKGVEPNELVFANIDLALGNDITAPLAINEIINRKIPKVFDNNKIALVADHFTPNKDIKSAEQVKLVRDFAKKYDIVNFFEGGNVGVEHTILPEKGLVLPGDLVIGADSHTCTYGALGAFSTGMGSTDLAAAMIKGVVWLKVPETIKFVYKGDFKKFVSGKDLILYTIGKIGVDGALYKSMEFTGDPIKKLSMDSRFSMCNMAIEAGAKNGIIEPDDTTLDYIKNRAKRPHSIFKSDDDASYSDIIEIDLDKIDPQVALPHLPENSKSVYDLDKIYIDQVVIGSCTNGRIEDFRVAAEILKGKKAAKYLRLIIIPSSPEVYRQAMDEGLFTIFLEADAIISPPTCGPCLGGHMGILAKGEKALATTNRNFVGRMGHPESEVYLSNPAVAAASAVKGFITAPE